MVDIIQEKFGDSEESQNVISKMSRWLAGAPDRSGGRKLRNLNIKKKSTQKDIETEMFPKNEETVINSSDNISENIESANSNSEN